jgi:hypothetical protein
VNAFLTEVDTIGRTSSQEDAFMSSFLLELSRRGLVDWQIPFEEAPILSATKPLGVGIVGEGDLFATIKLIL